MPSCHFCRRFFQHAGTLENHVEREHLLFFRASPIDQQADSSLLQFDLEPSDTETSNAELRNTVIGPHGWDFAPSSPTCNTLHRTPQIVAVLVQFQASLLFTGDFGAPTP